MSQKYFSGVFFCQQAHLKGRVSKASDHRAKPFVVTVDPLASDPLLKSKIRYNKLRKLKNG